MIDTTFSRQDKFGFYQTGNFRTYSRFEAVEESVRSGHGLHWNFNDEIYSCLDWTQEPKQSLEELYRQRAQQLRDKYDYLVLWFSGGADSTNILNSFIDNNIKLDEVASYVNYEATKDSYSWLNAEIYHVAASVVDKVRIKQPGLLHTVVDISQSTLDYFLDRSAKFDWIYDVNTHINPNACGRDNIKLTVPHWRKLFDSGKKVGFIYGFDKPRLEVIDGKYYFTFKDFIDGAVNAECQRSNRSWEFNELFYWTPDMPNIPIKQSHIVKNYLKLSPDPLSCLRDPKQSDGKIFSGKWDYFLKSSVLHTLIYPGWIPVLYQQKTTDLTFSPRDTWFFNLPDSDPAKYAWQAGLKHRWKLTKDFLKENPDNASCDMGASRSSKPYYLGE
jgi:hypothetical protein